MTTINTLKFITLVYTCWIVKIEQKFSDETQIAIETHLIRWKSLEFPSIKKFNAPNARSAFDAVKASRYPRNLHTQII